MSGTGISPPLPQLKMPSGSTRPPMQSSRSSRRGGSSAPKVLLGGGAGVLGSGVTEKAGQKGDERKGVDTDRQTVTSPFLATSSPRTANFPVQFPSPSSPSFPHQPQPPKATSSRPTNPSNRSKPGTSDSSLSTTASTSSRTLKTPHSKLEADRVEIKVASSSGSHEDSESPSAGMHHFRRTDYGSPTPATHGQPRKSSLGAHKVLPSHPLPPLPPPTLASSLPARKASNRPVEKLSPVAVPDRQKGQRVEGKKENRLSQDWVQIPVPESAAEVAGPSPPRPSINRTRSEQPQLSKISAVDSLPIKGGTPSPERPRFDRANTAPVSPTPIRDSSKQGRGSLDQLRAASPTPLTQPVRKRLNSMSTPPALVLEPAANGSKEAKGSGVGMFRNGSAKRGMTPPPLQTRRSEDILRSGTGASKDDGGSGHRGQQSLGNGPAPIQPASQEGERKSSGLSLKKSSGALKALFNRGASGKGKEKERDATPPMPSAEERKISLNMAQSRPSISDQGRPSFGRSRTPSANSPVVDPRDSPRDGQPGRASFNVEPSMYPAPPMQRAVSDSASATLSSTSSVAQPPWNRNPTRDLPALPPNSAFGTRDNTSRLPPAGVLSPSETDTSLAYMARNSIMFDGRPLSMYKDETADPNMASGQSMEFERKSLGEEDVGDRFGLGLPTVKSLHLLALPDLDLDFDVSFDGIGGSPTTPRRPRSAAFKSGSSSGEKTPVSPQRSKTLRASPQHSPTAQKHRIERRRSKSFDGVGGSTFLGDLWRGQGEDGFISPSMAKLFANPSSSSAPLLSKQLVDLSPALLESTALSVPKEKTLPAESAASSAMSHDRTPSNASSVNESTASPSTSPPRTPPDVRTAFGLKPVFPTRSASGDSQEAGSSEEGERGWTMGKAPNVPLPAVPEVPAMIVTPASAPEPPAPQVKLALNIPATVPEPKLASPANISAPTALGFASVDTRPVIPASQPKRLHTRSQPAIPDNLTTTKQLLRELETLLQTFRYPSHTTTGAERASMLRNELIGLITEIDKRPVEAREEQINASLREACFQWAEALLFELRVDQAANERGACLEGLSAVLESSCLSERSLLRGKPTGQQQRFTQVMIKAMTFVMGKLGAKGVFHNTLLFSGRFLAFAFFRVPHIAEQLVTVLPPPRGALMRFTRSVLMDTPILPENARPKYPGHLAPLCFDDSRSYTARLANLSADFATPAERGAFLFQPGNWLRRWQSDDSELFPAFYRAYHRQLAIYLSPVLEHYEKLDRPVPASILMRAPGYAHLATIFATKCHSYILGSVNAVTTSSSANSFEAQETAGFRGSQKPAVLETANRRIVETISTFANARMIMPSSTSSGSMIECEGSQLWGDMIDVWTKSIISKTSLYAPKGVFSLFDLLDGIVDPPFDTSQPLHHLSTILPAQPSPFAESLLDVSHLIYVIRLILTQGEHALTLVKVIAFVFTHWEVLTARAEDRRELCLGLLLTKDLFERLTLFWSQSVRSYTLRLVVFRLGHLHTKKEDGEAYEVEIESVKLLQTRLDRIKKRHDELEPKPPSVDIDLDSAPLTPIGGEGGLSHSRSTITMVHDSPSMSSSNKAERLLGLGFGMETKEEEGRIGKATNWFKKRVGGGGKKGNKKPNEGSSSRSPSPSPSLEGSPFVVGALANSPKFGSPGGARLTPKVPQKSGLSSPMLPSPASEQSTGSPVESSVTGIPGMSSGTSGSTRKAPPPTIMTTPHSPETPIMALRSPRSPNPSGVAFEFELPTASPRSDSFDRAPVPSSPRRKSQPPSPRGPASPHMSRSFSKRSSLLPPPTASALDSLLAGSGSESGSPSSGSGKGLEVVKEIEEEGYPVKKHAYAIRMLAELEDAQKEYDEWWSENGVGRMDGAPPRLTVAWPFHDGDD